MLIEENNYEIPTKVNKLRQVNWILWLVNFLIHFQSYKGEKVENLLA